MTLSSSKPLSEPAKIGAVDQRGAQDRGDPAVRLVLDDGRQPAIGATLDELAAVIGPFDATPHTVLARLQLDDPAARRRGLTAWRGKIG
jgi:hypothetical protein